MPKLVVRLGLSPRYIFCINRSAGESGWSSSRERRRLGFPCSSVAAVNPSLHIVAGARLLRASKLGQRNQRKNGEQGGMAGYPGRRKQVGNGRRKRARKERMEG